MESSPFSTISDLRRRKSEKETKDKASGQTTTDSLRLRQLSSLSMIPLSLIGLVVAYLVFTRGTESSDTCQTQDHPNILHEQFPNNATGNFNATIAIIPISVEQAKQYIPSQYKILEDAYRSLLPDFPARMYPLMMQAGHDHDIRFQEFSIADFSRVGFEFPFLDLLGDGYSSFRWAPEQMITASNADAISGSEMYGTKVHAASFQPECDAFAATNGGSSFKSKSDTAKVALSYRPCAASGSSGDFPIHFYKNVTSQPIFVDGSSCCQHIRLFDTRLSLGEYAPTRVKARIEAKLSPFREGKVLKDIDAIQVLTPFIENNYLPCDSLKGSDGQIPQEILQLLR